MIQLLVWLSFLILFCCFASCSRRNGWRQWYIDDRQSAQPKLPSKLHARKQTDSVITINENRINGCRHIEFNRMKEKKDNNKKERIHFRFWLCPYVWCKIKQANWSCTRFVVIKSLSSMKFPNIWEQHFFDKNVWNMIFEQCYSLRLYSICVCRFQMKSASQHRAVWRWSC